MSPRDALILVCAFAAVVPLAAWAVTAILALRVSRGAALLIACAALCGVASVIAYPVVPRISDPMLGGDGWRTWQRIADISGILGAALRAAAACFLLAAVALVPKKDPA